MAVNEEPEICVEDRIAVGCDVLLCEDAPARHALEAGGVVGKEGYVEIVEGGEFAGSGGEGDVVSSELVEEGFHDLDGVNKRGGRGTGRILTASSLALFMFGPTIG